ncbi:MAG: caspase family protein, partial [Candidatus Melainabacteria bacterium]|nr:caspase family protein [Candidatus Melainabacteria bacterium]
ITARLSYFDLRSLKSAEPSISESETLRVQAEQQLRKDVEEANARLQKLSAQRLPKAEIDALAGDLQKEINAKQKALVLFVQNSSAAGTQKITSAVASLSKQGKFEILLERDGVMYGIDKVVAAGPNVTENILAILQPTRLPATISSATRQTQPNGELPPASTQTSNASDKSNSNAIRDKWAVIIGVSKFKDPAYNLMYSAKDAEDFRNYLIKDAKFSSDHVLTLVNEQATRANIMRAFGSKWLPNLVEPGDLVVIYISTHGTPSSLDSGGRNYIVAYDTDVNDLYATAVDMDELARRIKEIKSDRAVIVLDTCYSGAGIPGSRGLYRHDSFDANKIDVGHGQMVICASSPNERSWESKTCQNGVFTRHLIDSLRLSSNLDLRKAFDKCAQQVQWEVKRDRGYAQTPQLGGKWEGVPLILSLPATEPRKMSMDKFSDFGLPANDQIARNPAIRKENPIPASQSVSAVSRMKQGVSTIPNIAGHWVASYGAHYQFWQKGKEYGWKFPHEEGRGVISDDGQSVLCQWWGQRSGKDTAKLEYDSNGVVVRIVGANGVTLSRH